MSTKIHNAYRLTPGTDVFTLRRELIAKLVPVLLQARAQKILTDAVGSYNEGWAEGKSLVFVEVLRNTLHEADRDIEDPLTNANVMVFENPVRGECYIKVYGDLTAHDETLLTLDTIAEDFHYSDATDQPEGFTSAQWRDRARAWDEALDNGNDFLKALGVEINLFSRFSARMDPQRLGQFGATIPTLAQQVERLGSSLAMRAAISEAGEGGNAVQAAWSRYLAWINGSLDKAPYMAEAHAIIDVRPEPVLP